MNWAKSLMITSVFGVGIALVFWLVSKIAGDSGTLINSVLGFVFVMVWFWVHQSMKDSELGHQPHK